MERGNDGEPEFHSLIAPALPLAYNSFSEENAVSARHFSTRPVHQLAPLSLYHGSHYRCGHHDRRNPRRQNALALRWAIAFRLDGADRHHADSALVRVLRWRTPRGRLTTGRAALLGYSRRRSLSRDHGDDLPADSLLVSRFQSSGYRNVDGLGDTFLCSAGVVGHDGTLSRAGYYFICGWSRGQRRPAHGD